MKARGRSAKLPSLIAGKNGIVGWSWSVPRTAPPGTWKLTALCTANGQHTRLHAKMHVSGTRGRGALLVASTFRGLGSSPQANGQGAACTAPFCATLPGNPFTGGLWGQCTWYAAQRRIDLENTYGSIPSRSHGFHVFHSHAKYWLADAQQVGAPTGPAPVPGAIAVWGSWPGNNFGHVAYVEGASSSSSVDISDYNGSGGPIRYGRHTINPATRWPNFLGYIYGGPAGNGPAARAPQMNPAVPTNPTTTPTTPTNPTTPPNRQATTSYDQMRPGAPHHAFFNNAWQPFVAQTNTITYVGATVGTPALPAGQAVAYQLPMRICTNQPDVSGNCNAITQTFPQIVNYGNTAADVGDLAVTKGATYWLEWLQPPPVGGSTWVTFWWAGGTTIGASDQMQSIVKGYDR